MSESHTGGGGGVTWRQRLPVVLGGLGSHRRRHRPVLRFGALHHLSLQLVLRIQQVLRLLAQILPAAPQLLSAPSQFLPALLLLWPPNLHRFPVIPCQTRNSRWRSKVHGWVTEGLVLQPAISSSQQQVCYHFAGSDSDILLTNNDQTNKWRSFLTAAPLIKPADPAHYLPMESSKVIGLVPTDGSIIVTSKRDANSRKSSFCPRKPWGGKQEEHRSCAQPPAPQRKLIRTPFHSGRWNNALNKFIVSEMRTDYTSRILFDCLKVLGTHLRERVDLLDVHSCSLWYLNTRLPWLVRSTRSLRHCCNNKGNLLFCSHPLYISLTWHTHIFHTSFVLTSLPVPSASAALLTAPH